MVRVNTSTGVTLTGRARRSQVLSVSFRRRGNSLVRITCSYTNMARSGVAALALACLLAVLETGYCLRCYQCNSQSDPTCADPYTGSTRYLVDCSSPDSTNYNRQYLRNILPNELIDRQLVGAPRYCHKIVLQSNTVIRTCLDGNPNDLMHSCQLLNDFAPPNDVSRRIKHCSVCEKEGCNGAGSITASLPLAALALIASYFYYKQ